MKLQKNGKKNQKWLRKIDYSSKIGIKFQKPCKNSKHGLTVAKKKDEWEQDRHKVVKIGLKKVKIGMKLQETTSQCQNVQHILG